MSHQTISKKTQTSKSTNDEKSNELAVAGPSSAGSPPKIFKLTIDCFDEIFEYLSMKDLHSLGQTCKTMQQVAGEYFKQNYSSAEKFCGKNGIYTVHSSRENVVNERILTSGFNEFMPCISHYQGNLEPLEYLQSHIDEFCQSTNHLYLVELTINSTKVEFIENLLPKLEIVQIRSCDVNGNFYELMLKHCLNLKCIYIQNADTNFNGSHEWLLQDYPDLVQLELMPRYPNEVEELYTFLERHPKMQRFSTSGRFLWSNRHQFLKSKAKLDILEVKAGYFYDDGEPGGIKTIWDLLKQLHKQGFYKRLFIYTDRVDQDVSIQLTSVPGLELLCIRWFDKCFNLHFLANLKELIILDGLNANDADILANGLVKLERLYVDKTTIECVEPFIRQSTKLNKIKLLLRDTNELAYCGGGFFGYYNDDYSTDYSADDYDSDGSFDGDEDYDQSDDEDGGADVNEDAFDGVVVGSKTDSNEHDVVEPEPEAEPEAEAENINDHSNEEQHEDEAKEVDVSDWRVLKLIALNKERSKLSGARKITLYVRDDVFLSTKWATRNGDINLSLIEMKRSDSLEWNHHY